MCVSILCGACIPPRQTVKLPTHSRVHISTSAVSASLPPPTDVYLGPFHPPLDHYPPSSSSSSFLRVLSALTATKNHHQTSKLWTLWTFFPHIDAYFPHKHNYRTAPPWKHFVRRVTFLQRRVTRSSRLKQTTFSPTFRFQVRCPTTISWAALADGLHKDYNCGERHGSKRWHLQANRATGTGYGNVSALVIFQLLELLARPLTASQSANTRLLLLNWGDLQWNRRSRNSYRILYK